MANSTKIVPFILKWEGGLSKNPADTAALYPVPDGSGYHTNKGITWRTWSGKYGTSDESIKRFYAMSQTDWNTIFKPLFWDALQLDKVNSQRIADVLANWAWGSGPGAAAKAIQKIVGVTADGVIGPQTIKAINAAPEQQTFDKLKAANVAFFNQLVQQPQYSDFKKGWFNRLDDLYNNYIKKIAPGAIMLLGVVFLSYWLLKK